MTPRRGHDGPVVADLRAIQSPDHRGRGIGRYAYEFATAVERVRPDLVAAWLLDPDWAPPGAAEELFESGKVVYAGSPAAERATSSAKVFHCSSPFELGVPIRSVWPALVEWNGMAYSATAYDLIPLRDAATYLRHPAQRLRYHARLEVLRNADALLAISDATGRDLVELLGVRSERVHAVGTGVSRRLRPPPSAAAAVEGARSAVTGLRTAFVLYPGGNDGRKNIEGLIEAFGRLPPDLATTHQLVIVGDLPSLTANHYRHIASLHGVEEHLLLTGYIPDDVLELLYQAARLVCFPSRLEGYGLPVAEALACGTPVAVSDRPPLDELVPAAAARYSPDDPAEIATVIERCLTDERLRSEIVASGQAALSSWDDVARRAGAVWDSLAAGERRRWPRRRRIAMVSPMEPLPSGVADYTSQLAPSLRSAAASRSAATTSEPPIQIDFYADGLDRASEEASPVGADPIDARRLESVEAATGGYDAVCYVLGNSEFHSAALRGLRRRPGVVMTHDVRLSGLLHLSEHVPGAVPGGLEGAIRRAYGAALPKGLGRSGLSPADEERYGLLLIREIVAIAPRVLVSSEAALRLAELDVGPRHPGVLGVLPFAVERLNPDERAAVARRRSEHKVAEDPGTALVVSFGIVNQAKRPDVLVEAVALVPGLRLAFVGPISDADAHELRALAERAGAADRVELTGRVEHDEYLDWLGKTDLAVQLRKRDSGEASGTVSECLSVGLPVVVSACGWTATLPAEAVRHVAQDISPPELAAVLSDTLRDGAALGDLGSAGARYAADHTFAKTAEALLDELIGS